MTVNKAGYERRLELVRGILEQYKLLAKSTVPLAYFETCPFPFNNFLYKVELESPATSAFDGAQHGTAAAPGSGVSTVVIRLSNLKADGLNNANRVQNEVAWSMLARQALEKAGLGSLVPDIYAWGAPKSLDASDEGNFGWIVSAFRAGVGLDEQFPGLPASEQSDVLETIASIASALQKAPIPSSVNGFGGLAFDDSGNLTAAQMALLPDGPWTTYTDVWATKLQAKLAEADEKPALDGWKEQDVSSRVKAFVSSGGLQKALEKVDVSRRNLIHGDLTMNNMLYDKDSKKVTAVLDPDWSCVNHPIEEFLTGFHDICHALIDDPEGTLSSVMSNDFANEPPTLSNEDKQRWHTAKIWNSWAVKKGVILPADIDGIREIHALQSLSDALCPFQLCNAVAVKSLPEEAKANKKKESLAIIIPFLEARGF